MWHLIDKEMALKECSIYCYEPDDDPYDGEEGALWSFNYFFFNKTKKRVCYLYLRGVSIIEAAGVKTPLSAVYTPTGTGAGGPRSKRCASGTWSLSSAETGAKRARFWLGDRAGEAEIVGTNDDDDDDDDDHEDEDVDLDVEQEDMRDEDDTPVRRNTRGVKRHGKGRGQEHRAAAAVGGGNKGDDGDHGGGEEEAAARVEGVQAEEEEGEKTFMALSSTDEAGSQSPCKGREKSL